MPFLRSKNQDSKSSLVNCSSHPPAKITSEFAYQGNATADSGLKPFYLLPLNTKRLKAKAFCLQNLHERTQAKNKIPYLPFSQNIAKAFCHVTKI